MPRPTPAQLYEADDLQSAYESGYQQMYEHDSLGFADRLDGLVEALVAGQSRRRQADLRAAALDGAADALRALGARMWEAARWE